MLSRTLMMASILLAYVILGACTDSPTYRSVDAISSVSFLDKGAVVPDPVSTLVVVDPENITCVSTRNGVALSTWTARIENRDYEACAAIIRVHALFGAPDPPVGPRACVGSQGMVVVLTADGIAHTITIDGVSRCDTASWPSGLGSLVYLKDALVRKYAH